MPRPPRRGVSPVFSQFTLVSSPGPTATTGPETIPQDPALAQLEEHGGSALSLGEPGPSQIIRSKQHRSPEAYRGQNVLVVGAGVSAMDICHELAGVASNTYQSVRGGKFDILGQLSRDGLHNAHVPARGIFQKLEGESLAR